MFICKKLEKVFCNNLDLSCNSRAAELLVEHPAKVTLKLVRIYSLQSFNLAKIFMTGRQQQSQVMVVSTTGGKTIHYATIKEKKIPNNASKQPIDLTHCLECEVPWV